MKKSKRTSTSKPALTPSQGKVGKMLKEYLLTRLQARRYLAQENYTSDSDKPPLNESNSEPFKSICRVWEKAGLDFRKTALLFTPPGNSPEELRTDAAFKQLAKESLEKEGILKPDKEP